jgi:general secretion pathway protein D
MLAGAVFCLSDVVSGQTVPAAPATQGEPTVTIDLPDEGIELRTLADIVTKRLGIPILYDENIANKKVVIRVPREVPESALMGVLQSALRMKGLALVDAEQPGWKQIVALPDAGAARPAGPAGPMEIRFVPVQNADATTVVNAVRELIKAAEGELTLSADERLNQIIVIAPRARVDSIVELISGMDKPVRLVTKVYRPKAITPDRIDKLVRGLLGGSVKRMYESTTDRPTQSLVVSATVDVHARIEQLLKELDVPTTAEQNPVRFYKLKNTKAADVLATIADLFGQTDSSAGLDESALAPGEELGSATTRPSMRARDLVQLPNPRLPRSFYPAGPEPARSYVDSADAFATDHAGGVQTADASVTADPNTNSIIVIAPPAVQQLYSDLIQRLDIRRPQVQIECTIVTLDTTDNFTFGVDIGGQGSHGETSIISFSSFGVSLVNPITGNLTPTGGRGGTLAVLSPGDVDIVIRALAQNSRARLVSAPQLLVNDNGKGQLKSIAEQPYAEILDTAAAQSRTSLGGYAQAGTTITIEPHISHDDYLQLSYALELSNFTAAASAGLPPPSQRNQIESTVTIPDGNTIVVGGLSLKSLRETHDSIPWINQVPVVNWLFGTRTKNTTETTLFVFIRPTVLRDDQFADLKYLSDRKTAAAGIEGSHPQSRPIPLR